MPYRSSEIGNSSEIECGQCGASFYYELLQCPECGAPVYGENEEDEEELPIRPRSPSTHVNPSALPEGAPLVLGLFTAALLLLVIYFPLRTAFQVPPTRPAKELLLLTAGLSAAGGGWIAGRFSSHLWRIQGLLVGAGALAAALLINDLMYAQGSSLFFQASSWPLFSLVVLNGWAGAALAERMQRLSAVETLFGPVIQENLYYQRLLAITGYDKEVVERLIAHEGRRSPGASRLEKMRRAVERWERDNR